MSQFICFGDYRCVNPKFLAEINCDEYKCSLVTSLKHDHRMIFYTYYKKDDPIAYNQIKEYYQRLKSHSISSLKEHL